MLPPILQLALIVAFGIGAQWLAWRVSVPSILFLLVAGWISGPVLGWIRPDALVGDLLMPLVSLSVGLILFEGGMSLKYKEIAIMGRATWHLVTIGAAATALLAAASAHYVLGFEWPVASLTGAILVVTGPTVIGPMLRHIRPSPQVASVLKWEGIVIDPVGAILAVLVFESAANFSDADPAATLIDLAGILAAGTVAGLAGAAFLLFCLRRFWIPDYLENTFVLALVLLVFAGSNEIQRESGLIATTLMGIAVVNQDRVVVKHVIAFKENLRVLILSVLFILLSARLDDDFLRNLDWRTVLFATSLVLFVRPIAVFLSTIGTNVPRAERVLLAWVAPRGIVAAAITSVFAFEMQRAGHADAPRMVPVVFFVIAFTVAIYGLSARPVARWLKVTQPDPTGILIAGAHPFARSLGLCLQEAGVKVLLVDRNAANARAAKLLGLHAIYTDILDESLLDDAMSSGMGNLFALTPNDKVNCLAGLQFAEIFEKKNIYQLAQAEGTRLASAEVPRHFMGRVLFQTGLTYEELENRLRAGFKVKLTPLSPQFTFADYKAQYEDQAIPLLALRESNVAHIFVAAEPPRPESNLKIIGLVPPSRPERETNLPAVVASTPDIAPAH